MRREGKKIRESSARYLISGWGPIWRIWSRMEKLFSYTLGREEITPQDIDAISTGHITNQIFAMVDAVAARTAEKGAGPVL